MDGTFLTTKGAITDVNKKAVRAAEEAGHLVMICSGRPHDSLLPFLKEEGLDGLPISGSNGGITIVDNKIIDCVFMSQAISKKLYNWLDEHKYPFKLFTDKGTFGPAEFIERAKYEFTENPPIDNLHFAAMEEYMNRYPVAPVTGFDDLPEDTEIFKFFISTPNMKKKAAAKEFARQLGGLNITSSFADNVELSDQNGHKGTGITAVAKHFNIPMEDTVAIGDNHNDSGMFEVAGLSIAMGNAEDEIKEMTDVVTLTNDENGVAHAIYKYILEMNNDADCCGDGCECGHPDHEATTVAEIEATIAQLQAGNSEQSAELIGLTAEIAVPLYGVINFQELADILNHYHPTLNVVKDDILPALTTHIEFSGEDVDYTIFEGFIVSPIILPDAIEITDSDVELIDNIRAKQKNHERYLPDYEEFAQYATQIHEVATDSFANLLNFLGKNRKRLGIKEKEIANLAANFLHLLKFGMKSKYFVDFFQDHGCNFGSKQFVNEFMGYAGEVQRNTRMYALNGHTLNELELENDQGQRVITKVGRNEPCPCGSGKKHKKCCL